MRRVWSVLQWVHGRITVVMPCTSNPPPLPCRLQWVHGRITVVMSGDRLLTFLNSRASMGPRSDNRGYAFGEHWIDTPQTLLQWVHGRITVVMALNISLHFPLCDRFNGSTVG